MDIRLNDVLEMKKTHPCGEKRWQVLRTGMDFRLRCLGCGREVMTPRFKAEKSIRAVFREGKRWTSSKGEKPSTGCGTAPPGSAGKFGASGGKRLPFYIWHRFLTETGRNSPGDCDLFFVPGQVY